MRASSIVKIVAIAFFLAVWELVCRSGTINSIILAPPSEIILAMLTSWREFLGAFQVTIVSIAIAMSLAWTIGISLGFLIAFSPLGYGIISPMLIGLFSVPLIMIYPLFLIWFGIGPGSKIAFATLTGSIPIALSTMDGVRQIDRSYVSFAHSIGASATQAYLKIYLPLSLPAILSGLRIGTSLVVTGVVVCEMLASFDGLGFWISYNRTIFNTGHVYLGIALALASVAFVNLVLGHIERRFGGMRAESDRATKKA